MESNILHHSACHVSATDTCKTGISHCDKKLARLLLNIGVNATDGDCEQQVRRCDGATIALCLQQLETPAI